MTIPARFALVAALGGLLIGSVMGLTACEAGARPSDATVPAPSPAATGVALPTPTTRPIAYPVPLTAQASPVSSQPGELESGGQRRHYLLHVPPGYAADQPAPLAINLHGLGSNAAQQEQISGMSRLADAKTFIVVYPEALGDPATWRVGAGSPDVAFIRDLIQHLAGQYRIDPARIYATGISNGGGMANRLGCDMADVIAAIAPVSGAYLFWQDCQPGRPVPVLAFHGTADRIVPYEGGQGLPFVREWAETWAARNGCTSPPAVTLQRGEVIGETWDHDCQAGAEVVLYTIAERGHSWPGSNMPAAITTQNIDATIVMWDFFSAHPLPQ